jgi:hypothetical protein
VTVRATAIGLLLLVLAVAPAADARQSRKKSIWGPVEVNGVSQFPIYRDLGVGIFQMGLSWAAVAPSKPADPRDPADPAYRWPSAIDAAISRGKRYGIKVSLLVGQAPSWANGGQPPHWAPRRPRAIADFAVAAARRYGAVRHWMLWGEPSKASRFQPLVSAVGRKLTPRQKQGPRRYARMLDATYGALKRVNRHNLIIGGNTWTGGEVTPLNFIRAMRLPSGRRPRMDLYGHNPFTARAPRLSEDPLRYGFADFSDLDTLAGWLDRYGYRDRRGRRLRLFLSEFVIQTDHGSYEFNYYVDRRTQAGWLARSLRITRRWKRIYTLGYLGLYDEQPRPDGLEVNRGLIDWRGRKKPAYLTYRRG